MFSSLASWFLVQEAYKKQKKMMLFFIVFTAGVIKHFHEGPGRKYLGFIDYDVVMAALL